MKYYRYGKFKFGDYFVSWCAISMLLIFTIAGVIFNLPFLFIVFPALYAMIWLVVILYPHRERFILCENSIVVLRGNQEHTIILPPKLTLVMSYVDICPPLTKRTAIGNKSHILKKQYAVSILKEMPLDTALEQLHKTRASKYTTSMIQTIFADYQYIYSFVCNQQLLERLIADRKCLLIIPESISKTFDIKSNVMQTHIDIGF